MKKLTYLKFFINFFFTGAIVSSFFLLVKLSKVLFDYKIQKPFQIENLDLVLSGVNLKIVLSFITISSFVFIYGIYLLKKVVLLFMENKIFDDQVILLLNKIGKILILSALLKGIPILCSIIFSFQEIGTGSKNDNYIGFHFSVYVLALFFMVLSEVFKIAKNLKDENELTV
ncbi:hypothetical protein HNQ02_000244 [Flavobacterium sp. 7E]|uniref:DUF2975 domain-containing protein n=1 Tax=unclassified Flavobacterium TaxID=196869 RepID=UPI00156FCFA0|nr:MULTISPECIES: DUF2975 domain-containing protein [unclassified Flavobacterium]NRS87344.1 hypothetical protein [Flavobacterium sp. 7E]NRT13939.1 hypothetical protein [Flavobacterium sp. 28A]